MPELPGTVTGFGHGKVQVQFDDFGNEPAKALRLESLQLAESPAQSVNETGWSLPLSTTRVR